MTLFARVSTLEGPADQIEEGVRASRERVLPEARRLDGFKGVFVLADRASGKSLTITLWAGEEAMRASEEAANRLRSQAAELEGAAVRSVERFEVVIHEIEAGA